MPVNGAAVVRTAKYGTLICPLGSGVGTIVGTANTGLLRNDRLLMEISKKTSIKRSA